MFCQCTPVFNYSLGCLTTQLHHRNSAKPFNTTPSGIIQSSCTSNTTKWFNITAGLCLKHFSFKDLSSLSRYMKDFVMTVWDQIETRSLSESGEKYAQIKHCLQAKPIQNSSKHICRWILMWEDNKQWTGGSEIMDYGFIFDQKWQFKVKTMELFLVNTQLLHITVHSLIDWSHVDCLWIVLMFLSAVWTLILTAPIYCRGSIGQVISSTS